MFKHAAKIKVFRIGTLFREKRGDFLPQRLLTTHNMNMNILYPSMLHLKLCFATIRSICVERKSQPTLPWRTGGPVCKGKRINHVTAASEEPDNRI